MIMLIKIILQSGSRRPKFKIDHFDFIPFFENLKFLFKQYFRLLIVTRHEYSMPETRTQKEQRSRANALRELREKLDPYYTDAYVQKLENALWSAAQEESEKTNARAAAAIAANTTPPAVRDPLKIYNDPSTIKVRAIAAMRKIKPEDGDMIARPHGKRSSSQGRKNTSVHELGDSHNVISNHAVFAFSFAVVLLLLIIQH